MRLSFLTLGVFLGARLLTGAEVIPPPPAAYFNDYATVVAPATAAALNQELESFERQTSNQVVVAIYPTMASPSSLEDYTHRVMQSWGVGQKSKNNGVALFVFIANREARIEVAYGLEGALPDALCKRIIEEQLLPSFRTADYGRGLTLAVSGIEAAIRGEYTGTGSTAADSRGGGFSGLWIAGLIVLLFVLSLFGRRYSRGGTVYDRNGSGLWAIGLLMALFGGGGGGRSGGGFSGGGGSGGGGGASGRW